MERKSIQLEFIFRASPNILYQFLTDPAALVRWFCDDVEIIKSSFSFFWDGSEENAELVEDIEGQLVRFEFEDYEDGEYLEFKMAKNAVTNETVLELTDYCDEDEVDDQRQLWESQMERLRQEMGG